MHNIAVVHKPQPAVISLAQEIRSWLEARGCVVRMLPNSVDICLDDTDAEVVIVVGGDGTMLGVARRLTEHPVPLLGINMGRVGFLTEISTDQWHGSLDKLLCGEYRVIKRLALRWRLLRGGELVDEGCAVNDAVMSRGALSRVVCFGVQAGTQDVCTIRADGLIISSPMGMSGYAVSAGGPLVHPELPAVVLTAICPFLCNFPPLVLPLTLPVRVEVLSDSVKSFLTLDGQQTVPLEPHDVVEVRGVPDLVYYVRIGEGTYFKRLKGRGFIEGYGHTLRRKGDA